jgi:hypothetical protein
MAATVKTKKVRQPEKTSIKKRPNKSYIMQMADFRGFMSGNEKVQLATLDVKNINQRVNNIAMSDDASIQFNGAENAELQRLMKQYVKDVESVLKSYKSR